MPYVTPAEGLNSPFLDLDALPGRPDEPSWRVALVGTPGLRVVLVRWEPGFATVPHHHPHAEEIFLVLEGRALFTVGDEPEREVSPGQLVFAERGTWHAIRVPLGGAPVTLLAAVAPNEDEPDETIELAARPQVGKDDETPKRPGTAARPRMPDRHAARRVRRGGRA
jgi:quercetin dioxygenase-like cupin family protein